MGGTDVAEPTPGPSGIASQVITDSKVVVTLDEGTPEEQEMTISIVSMDHTYSSELPPFLIEDSDAQDGGSRHGHSRSEERRILPDMLQIQANIEIHLKQLLSSVKDIASALHTIAGVIKDKA
ncbi:uncharacterized protein LOC125038728 [Penaeus chinensis]|uniref:uncharacterized protein LOC125038728 n=1 Tax=Penaeus chinensis TaxID=139456 RepID=UPI001FB693EF|nr:uncharacterized protein LOC125038728 [Penaeus chinensis]